jgi:hypothetical protein
MPLGAVDGIMFAHIKRGGIIDEFIFLYLNKVYI